jgi:hypothetical protein
MTAILFILRDPGNEDVQLPLAGIHELPRGRLYREAFVGDGLGHRCGAVSFGDSVLFRARLARNTRADARHSSHATGILASPPPLV